MDMNAINVLDLIQCNNLEKIIYQAKINDADIQG